MAVWVWLILAGILFVLELCTGEFVLCWFGVGCLVADIFAICSLPVWAQTLAFVIVGIVLLLTLRRLVLKLFLNVKTKKLNKFALNKVGVVKKNVAQNLLYLCAFDKKKFVVMLQSPIPLKDGDGVEVVNVINAVAIGVPKTLALNSEEENNDAQNLNDNKTDENKEDLNKNQVVESDINDSYVIEKDESKVTLKAEESVLEPNCNKTSQGEEQGKKTMANQKGNAQKGAKNGKRKK